MLCLLHIGNTYDIWSTCFWYLTTTMSLVWKTNADPALKAYFRFLENLYNWYNRCLLTQQAPTHCRIGSSATFLLNIRYYAEMKKHPLTSDDSNAKPVCITCFETEDSLHVVFTHLIVKFFQNKICINFNLILMFVNFTSKLNSWSGTPWWTCLLMKRMKSLFVKT